METTIQSPNYPEKKYCIRWNSNDKQVFIVFQLKDKSETSFLVGENAKSIENAKLVAGTYLKDNEDRFFFKS